METDEKAVWDKYRAGEYLGLSHHTLDQDVSAKTLGIPYIKIGKLRRYRKVDLDSWLESRIVNRVKREAA